jgi:hypothetical protein
VQSAKVENKLDMSTRTILDSVKEMYLSSFEDAWSKSDFLIWIEMVQKKFDVEKRVDKYK